MAGGEALQQGARHRLGSRFVYFPSRRKPGPPKCPLPFVSPSPQSRGMKTNILLSAEHGNELITQVDLIFIPTMCMVMKKMLKNMPILLVEVCYAKNNKYF